MRSTDFTIEFGFGHQRGHRIDHDHIDRIGLDQHLRDLQRLLSVGRLADEQFLEIDTQSLGPRGVQGVFGIDERSDAA